VSKSEIYRQKVLRGENPRTEVMELDRLKQIEEGLELFYYSGWERAHGGNGFIKFDNSGLLSEIQSLTSERDRLRELLKIARCPNTSCVDGAIPHGPYSDGSWEAEQCQWCDERSTALADIRSERMSELKPCPFCGGEAETARITTGGIDEITIGCANCRVTCYSQESVEAEAIEAWNKRAGSVTVKRITAFDLADGMMNK